MGTLLPLLFLGGFIIVHLRKLVASMPLLIFSPPFQYERISGERLLNKLSGFCEASHSQLSVS